MNVLPLPDRNYLEAAQGWLELGNPTEAEAELDRISPQWRVVPDVLEVQCSILAQTRRWSQCVEIAETITDLAPRRTSGWLFLAEALRRLELTEDAWEILTLVAEDFPDEAEIQYRIACYASALGACEEAADALERALAVGNQRLLEAKAVAEPDLAGLLEYLRAP
jgi:predicted Zn-dependent protease